MGERIRITVEVLIDSPLKKVWECWTLPNHITGWNFASDEWYCPRAENNLVSGGIFSWRMEAKDGSMGFDFSGKYKRIEPLELIENILDDERSVTVQFRKEGESTKVTETFETEQMNSEELQRQGWQAILNNFKKYVEALKE
jgi:uncharacterized protein YndB with AHSA1/START domain